MTWLTLYHNGSTLPLGSSWQGDPSVLDDDLRLLATLDPLVTV